MFKLVVALSVVALAAAEPALVYHSAWPVAPLYPYQPIATQPPNSPAVVLDPVSKVPLDTAEVVAAKIAHYQAKAWEQYGVHVMKKRSVVAYPYQTYPSVDHYSASWLTPYSSLAAYPHSYPTYPHSYSSYPYNTFNPMVVVKKRSVAPPKGLTTSIVS